MSKKSADASPPLSGDPGESNGGKNTDLVASARGLNVVFYDGICVVCDHTVQTLYKFDTRKNLAYATLQGPLAAAFDDDLKQSLEGVDSIVFITGFNTGEQAVHIRSTAVLRIVECLGGIYKAAAVFRIIPAPLRDWCYDEFAKRRYGIFGQKNANACFLPPPEDRGRFFD